MVAFCFDYPICWHIACALECLMKHNVLIPKGRSKRRRKNRQTASTGDLRPPTGAMRDHWLRSGLRPPARRIRARTIQARRPEAARRASSSRQGSIGSMAMRAPSCLLVGRWGRHGSKSAEGFPFVFPQADMAAIGLQGMPFLCPPGDRWGLCK